MVKGLGRATRSSGNKGGKSVNSGRGRKAGKKLATKKTVKTVRGKAKATKNTTKPVTTTIATARGNIARNTLAATRKRVNTTQYRISGNNPLN